MKPITTPLLLIRALYAACFLSFVLSAEAYTGSWPPASVPSTAIVSVEATVTETPPAIKLNFLRPGAYQIFRKGPDDTTWSAALATLSGSSTTWTDSTVNVGQLYEYKAVLTDGTCNNYYSRFSSYPTGYILTGIKVDQTAPKGRVVLVVASDVQTQLPTEFAQFQADLAADGWFVHVISCPRGNYTVVGQNALSTITVTAGGTGYTTGTVGLSKISSTSKTTALAKLTVSSGAITSASAILGGGGFNVGDPLYICTATSGSGAVLGVGSVTSGTNNAPAIRDQIIALNNTYPGEIKNVILLGRVPACRTGSGYVWDPDGHGVNLANYGADGYYANMTGTWTDTGSNYGSFTDPADNNLNVPGDGKFDQYYMYQTGGRADMGFGRIDMSNSIAGEYEALRCYFNKLHRYKVASPDFRAGRKICVRPAGFPQVSETGWMCGPGITGVANMDTAVTLPSVGANDDADAAFSAVNGPYLFYFKGSSAPANSVGGKAVFWTGMQSHWGWWYGTGVSSGENVMPLRLGEDSFMLSITWDIFGTRYFYHRMGMGMDAGDMMRVSINNSSPITGTYSWATHDDSYNGCIAPCSAGLFMDHFGDPTLRLFMFAPPSDLSVVSSGGNPTLTWTASTEATVIGYHVYRSASPSTTPFQRLTSTPIVGTNYTDSTVNSGQWTYRVCAVRLETSGGGTFYNPSLGVTQSIDLTNGPAPLRVPSATLPDARWNTAYQASLSSTGGAGLSTWSLTSGTLPSGITLSANGILSGTATTSGTYSFSAKATDKAGASVQQSYTLTARATSLTTLIPEASVYTDGYNPDRNQGNYEAIRTMWSPYQIYLRYDLSSLNLHNSWVGAKLILYIGRGTTANSYAPITAALTPDSGDGWVETSITNNNRPPDNSAIAPASSTAIPVPLSTVEIDVTSLVKETLANDPARKMSLHVYTPLNQTVEICARRSYGDARPRLVIETTDAPQITMISPASSPAGLNFGTKLQASATVKPIPARAGQVTVQWSQVSGPGTASISTPGQLSTTVAFPTVGDYVLRLTADDGLLQSTKDTMVRVLTVPAATAPVSGPTDHILLRVPFDEGSGSAAADVSGNGNSGTLVNGPVWGSGRIGGALEFNGAGQRVDIPDSATLDNQTQMSVSFWMKMDPVYPWTSGSSYAVGDVVSVSGVCYRCSLAHVATGTSQTNDLGILSTITVSSSGSGYTNADTVILSSTTSTSNATGKLTVASGTIASIAVTDGGAGFVAGQPLTLTPTVGGTGASVKVNAINNGWVSRGSMGAVSKRKASGTNVSYYAYVSSSNRFMYSIAGTGITGYSALPTGSWCHVVGVFDGALATNNTRTYINGVLDILGTIAKTSVPRNNVSPLRIGAFDDTDTVGFTGLLDDVRIYNKVLSQDEVLDLYSAAPSVMGPKITLNSTVSGSVGLPFPLAATVSDDAPSGPLTVNWSTVGGPGNASFGNPAAASTTATCPLGGVFTLRLVASDGSIATFADVTANITGQAFASWASGAGLTGPNAAATANPAGDGISNLMKYALGLDPNRACAKPTDGTNPGLPLAGDDGTNLTLTYQRDTAKTDITYLVEAGMDLTSWSTSGCTEQVIATNGTVQTVKVSVPKGSNPREFIRLKVVQ